MQYLFCLVFHFIIIIIIFPLGLFFPLLLLAGGVGFWREPHCFGFPSFVLESPLFCFGILGWALPYYWVELSVCLSV